MAAATDLTLTVGGRVTIELISSEAAFRNTLSVVSPAVTIAATGCKLEAAVGLPGVHILSEKLSQRGCRVNLDSNAAAPGIQAFASGTVFNFKFCAQTDADPACEFVWSSNPAQNSDGFDHVQITPIRPAEFPGQIFQLAWEDLPDGGDMDFDDLIVVLRSDIDTDGDGLWDDWEQFGIDTDGDGTVDLNLPALGANHLQQDIFVEIDFMDCLSGDCPVGDTHSHQPKATAVAAAVAAFANAGINLHVDVSNSIAHQASLVIPGLCFNVGAGIGNFDTVKANPANFGPGNPRRFAYHYALFTHQQIAPQTWSGCGELPGNDFQVSLGGWNLAMGDLDADGLADANVGTVQQQAGTLVHELGHNLNLRHGGGDNVNRKPNYLSVMNYAFQMRGIPPTDPDGPAPGGPLTARVDYSPEDLADLNEASLSEPAGIGDGTDNTRYFCPNGGQAIGLGTGAIDWNCDGDLTDIGIAVDVNGDGAFSVLAGFDDWANLRLDLQATGGFDDGVHEPFPDGIEIDFPTHIQVVDEVKIDIKPGSDPNSINYRSRGNIPVAILSTMTFDAPSQVDRSSITFGRTGFEPSLRSCSPSPEDVNGDGLLDLVCHFDTRIAGFQLGDTVGILRARTVDGTPLFGTDSVRIVG